MSAKSWPHQYDGGIQAGVTDGLAMGLSACGLFDLGTKAATIISGDKAGE